MVHLPWLQMDVSLPAILLAGFLGGALSGLIGVGGGIITNPLLISLGIPARYAAGTMPMVVIANAVSSLTQSRQRETIDIPFGVTLGLGGVPGAFTGTLLVWLWRDHLWLDGLIQWFYILVLLITIVRLLWPVSTVEKPLPRPLTHLPWRRRYEILPEPVSVLPLWFTGYLIGIFASFMGIGGAAFLTPVLLIMVRLPLKTIVVHNLIYVVITSTATALNQALVTRNSDLLLGVTLMVAGAVGAGVGVAVKQRLSNKRLSLVYTGILVLILLRLLWQMFIVQSGVINENPEINVFVNRYLFAIFSISVPVIIGFLIAQMNKRLYK